MKSVMVHMGKTDVGAGEVGYDPARLELLDAHLINLIETKKLQGASYLLSRHGKTFAHKAMGKLTFHKESTDLLPDSIRRIASITKLFTALAVMQLVEDGKLALSQEARTVIGEFDTDMHKGITVFHLLTHTSGIAADPGYFLEPFPREWWGLTAERDGYDNWIKTVLSGPLHVEPGKAWHYSTAGFTILGEIVARVSGMVFERYVEERIIGPLGMEETLFDVPEKLRNRVCVTNEWEEKLLQPKTEGKKIPPRAGSGVYSTLSDLARLAGLFLSTGTWKGTRILGRRAMEKMTGNRLKDTYAYCWGQKIPAITHGLGVSILGDDIFAPSFGHEGAGRSALMVDPAEELTAVFFVPTTVEWVPESMINVRNIIWSGLT